MYLEVFSGDGGLTAALKTMGLEAHAIDIRHGEGHNVLDPDVKAHIFKLVRRGMVKFVWIGMPCTTFSLARKYDDLGPPPLRSNSQPRGLEGLSRSQQRVLDNGNALFDFSISLVQCLNRCRVPWALENPATLRCWLMPEMVKIAAASNSITLAFCQYGEPWRKRTAILHHGIALEQLERQCTGVHGYCSRTNKRHLLLRGVNANHQFWTRVAQPYPLLLCRELAQELVAQLDH